MTKELTKAEESQIVTKRESMERMRSALDRMAPQIERALAGQLSPEHFIQVCYTLFRTTPALAKCKPISFLGAVLEAAQLRLLPGPPLGHCWIVPRKGLATFQLGYRGIVQLLYRSNMVKAVRGDVVRSSDHFIYRNGAHPIVEHEPSGEGELVASWAVIETDKGGIIPWRCLAADIERIKRRSDAARGGVGPWTNPDDEPWMWIKSALTRAGKLAPLEIQIQRAIGLDEMADAGLDQRLAAPIDAEFSLLDGDEDDLPPSEAFKRALRNGQSNGEEAATPTNLSDEQIQQILEAGERHDLTRKAIEKRIGGKLSDAPAAAFDEIMEKMSG